MPLSRWLRSLGVLLLLTPCWAPWERWLGSLRRPSVVLGCPVLGSWHSSARCWCQVWTEERRAFCSSFTMNGNQKLDAYNQEKQNFIQHFSQIVKVLTEGELGHPETGDAISRLKEVLEYNALGGKYNRGLTVLLTARELVEPSELDASGLQRALTVGWCVELLQAFFLVSDDIMDSSLTRRGQICWYQKPGIGLDAINDALLLEACIYRLLKFYCREQPYYLNLLELFLQSSYQTEIGQTLDLITAPQGHTDLDRYTEKRYKSIVKYKTAFYSFYLPVAAAMYMAGIDGEKEHANAKKILLEMGEFFQVQENYGQKDPEKVARVKALYEELDLPAAFLKYEEDSYSRLLHLIEQYAAPLPPAIFLELAKKIYKRKNSCSDLSPDESPVSVYSRDLPGHEVSHPQPSVLPLEQGSSPASAVRSSWSFAGVPGAQRLWMAEARSGTGQLQEQKKGLLIAVSASVDKIISHFGAARNLVQKAQLGDSRLSPDVGHLVLTTLCPALHALVADGLKPFRKDLITGQRRSSPWNVVEASVKPGSCTSSLGSLYSQVRRLAPLSSSRSRFHAFILGLLNTKQLELWFSSLQEDAGLLSLFYLPTGFFSLACGGCPSLATELLLLLQPLSVFTFHLDLLFEHHHHLPLAPPQAPAGPAGPPPALQQTVQAVLHWGSRLAQSLWGAPAEATQGPLDPPKSPPPGSWWDQLTQASRVYASGGTQGFPVLRWGPTHHESAAEDAQEIPPPTEQATAGRGMWLGRLFGVPGSPTETESGAFKSRRPSRWLPPTVSVLALMKRGIPPETPSPEELVASPASMGPADRAVRALCDHTAAGPDQLSFRRGDMLRVIATVDEDWLRCGRDGVEGLVP
uniref:Farnesyl pyrophosphate synthase n=1 Tax=Jaculus jaculus TaxID=51337 RepID=A0A8C5JZ86_JACJA